MNKVLNHTDSEIPDVLKDNNAARAYFGLSLEVYKAVIRPEQGLDLTQIALDTANRIDAIIRQHIFEDMDAIIDRAVDVAQKWFR